ncbi:MAG: ATP-binding cassette domain-containing protein, partial [Lachnospiraceae bacterium]
MIELINVTKKFGDFVAIEDTSLIFDEGKIYGIIGTNGAGKSTFLRLLSGVYSLEAGEILYDSEKVFNNSKVKKDICFVPDELYFEENSNLFIMAKRYKLIYPQFSQEKFDKLVEEFKLDKKKTFKTFSKGMRKLAAIILALSSGAKYLYFDG